MYSINQLLHHRLVADEWPTLAAISLFAVCLSFWWYLNCRATSAKSAEAGASAEDRSIQIDPPGRTAGHWQPVDFKFPQIQPAEYNVLDKACPKYRPFRWGPTYFTTMGIRSMAWPEWIQLDHEFPEFMKIREERAAEKGDRLIITLPGAEAAALECARELSAYLAKRYPTVYAAHPSGSEHSQGGTAIEQIECKVRNKKWRIMQSYPDCNEAIDDPMTICGLLVPDDTYIMMEREDGHYYLSAGAGCTPGFWRMKDKMGYRLRDLHLSSDVPYFASKLMKSMERFFSKLAVDKPVERNNYCEDVHSLTFFSVLSQNFVVATRRIFGSTVFQLDDVLAWNEKMMGEEEYFHHKTHSPHPDLISSGKVQWDPPQPIRDPEDLRLRSERQTLRRMPLSGCILFTVKTYITPLKTLGEEPRVPGRFASAIRSWDETVAEYKGRALFGPVVLPYLDKLHAEQVKAGIIAEDDRQQSYPY